MSIYEKLNKARAKFHSLELKKSGQNKFAGYNYFELSDFVIPAIDVFNEHGLCAVVSFMEDLARMDIHDIDGDGLITITSPMREANLKGCHPIQNLGAVETYQRRYLWMAALEIVEHDAIDSAPAAEGYTDEQAAKFQGLVWGDDSYAYVEFMSGLEDSIRDSLYNSFPQGKKVEGKKKCGEHVSSCESALNDIADSITQCRAENDWSSVEETLGDFKDQKHLKLKLWARLSDTDRDWIKSNQQEK